MASVGGAVEEMNGHWQEIEATWYFVSTGGRLVAAVWPRTKETWNASGLPPFAPSVESSRSAVTLGFYVSSEAAMAAADRWLDRRPGQ